MTKDLVKISGHFVYIYPTRTPISTNYPPDKYDASLKRWEDGPNIYSILTNERSESCTQ